VPSTRFHIKRQEEEVDEDNFQSPSFLPMDSLSLGSFIIIPDYSPRDMPRFRYKHGQHFLEGCLDEEADNHAKDIEVHSDRDGWELKKLILHRLYNINVRKHVSPTLCCERMSRSAPSNIGARRLYRKCYSFATSLDGRKDYVTVSVMGQNRGRRCTNGSGDGRLHCTSHPQVRHTAERLAIEILPVLRALTREHGLLDQSCFGRLKKISRCLWEERFFANPAMTWKQKEGAKLLEEARSPPTSERVQDVWLFSQGANLLLKEN
jgi:hypothetical protein